MSWQGMVSLLLLANKQAGEGDRTLLDYIQATEAEREDLNRVESDEAILQACERAQRRRSP